MSDQLTSFGDAHIAVVTFAEQEQLQWYRQVNDVPFPLLVDNERRVYHSYGLGRATTRRVWALRVWRRYFEIYRNHGFGNLRRATDDLRQLGGDFVIAGDGTLAYARWSTGPEDRPPIGDLIQAVFDTRS